VQGRASNSCPIAVRCGRKNEESIMAELKLPGDGTLGLVRSTAPLIKKARDASKDLGAKGELESLQRNRDLPYATERLRAEQARLDAIPVEPHSPVPDDNDDGKAPF